MFWENEGGTRQEHQRETVQANGRATRVETAECSREVTGPAKFCPRCETLLSLADFSKNRRRKDGSQVYCRQCMSRAVAAAHAKRRAYYTIQAAAWSQNNPDRVRAAKRRYTESGKNAEAERRRYSPEKRRAKSAVETASLCDRYVASKVARDTATDWREVPAEVISAKRAHLLLIRELRRTTTKEDR